LEDTHKLTLSFIQTYLTYITLYLFKELLKLCEIFFLNIFMKMFTLFI